MSNRKRTWEQRHKSAIPSSTPPDPFLKEHLDYLKPDTILDLACGSGRNSIFLSKQGFKVTAADFSINALNQLRASAARSKLDIETLQLDLETKADLSKLKRADNIVAIHYKPSIDLLELVPQLLNRDGIFLFCTFNLNQHQASNFPSKYCLESAELVDKQWNMKLLKYESFKIESGHHDGYLFRRI